MSEDVLKNFAVAAVPHNSELILICAENWHAHQGIGCVVTLDTLRKVFKRPTLNQADARRAVSAELAKFQAVILAIFKANPFAGEADPRNPSQLRYDLTLDDLQESGQSFSASVLDAPATVWGKDGKF
jgi:hypothetical protein